MSEAREDGPAHLPEVGEEVHLPDPPDEGGADKDSLGGLRSLLADVEDLVVDAKTYFDSELTYQRARATFVVSRVKAIAVYAVAAIVIVLMALFAVSVGLILALTPWLTAWGATAVVGGLLLAVVYLIVRRIGAAWGDIMVAVREQRETDDDT